MMIALGYGAYIFNEEEVAFGEGLVWENGGTGK